MKKILPLFLTFFALQPTAFLYASSGTEGASFLDIPVGAGPAALGSAYSAFAKDAYAPIYNPAGLGFVARPEIAAQHLSYLESIHYEFGSLVFPLGNLRNDEPSSKAFGASMQYLGSGDIAGTGTSGEAIGDFSVHYAAYSLAYGQKVTENLAVGLTGKLIDAKIADTSAKAYAGDAGAMYQASEKLTLSATANNLGSRLTFTSQGDSLPTAYHLGAAFRLQNSLKSTVEGIYSKTGLFSGRAGVEWSPINVIALRAGYKTDTIKGLSPLAGLTAGMGIRVLGQEFAYAWLPYGDLGDTQYFSMLIKFGAREETRRNLIQYQALKTHRSNRSVNDAHSDNDPEYQQLMQLLSDDENHFADMHSGKEFRLAQPPSDEPERSTLAPMVGPDRAASVGDK